MNLTAEKSELEIETARLMSLRSQHGLLDRQIAESNRFAVTNPKERADAQARQLLSGEEPAGENVIRNRSELYQRREIVARAIKMQDAIVARLRGERSSLMCEDVRAQHAEIVAEMCQHVVSLAKAADKERSIRSRLEADGVDHSSHLRAMTIADFSMRELDNIAGLFLREALEHGMISTRQLKAMGVPSDLLEDLRAVTGR